MKTPLFRNHNDGRVYDADNRTMFFVNDPTTAEEIVKIVNDNTALRSQLATVTAELDKAKSENRFLFGVISGMENTENEKLEQVTAEREAMRETLAVALVELLRSYECNEGQQNNPADKLASKHFSTWDEVFNLAALKGGKG